MRKHKAGASDSFTDELSYENDEMLWVDQKKIIGLRVRVEERKRRRDLPILVHKDEDQAISYSLELEGKLPLPAFKENSVCKSSAHAKDPQSWLFAPQI